MILKKLPPVGRPALLLNKHMETAATLEETMSRDSVCRSNMNDGFERARNGEDITVYFSMVGGPLEAHDSDYKPREMQRVVLNISIDEDADEEAFQSFAKSICHGVHFQFVRSLCDETTLMFLDRKIKEGKFDIKEEVAA